MVCNILISAASEERQADERSNRNREERKNKSKKNDDEPEDYDVMTIISDESKARANSVLKRSTVLLICGIAMSFSGVLVFENILTAGITSSSRNESAISVDIARSLERLTYILEERDVSEDEIRKNITIPLLNVGNSLKPSYSLKIVELLRPTITLLFLQAIAWFLLRQYLSLIHI